MNAIIHEQEPQLKKALRFVGSVAAAACFEILDYFEIFELGRAGCDLRDRCAVMFDNEVRS